MSFGDRHSRAVLCNFLVAASAQLLLSRAYHAEVSSANIMVYFGQQLPLQSYNRAFPLTFTEHALVESSTERRLNLLIFKFRVAS